MKIFSDWATGKPPCAGYWLTRPDKSWNPLLIEWNGETWITEFGQEMVYQDREWCGLAFNPESARYVMRWQDLTLEIEEFTL